MAPLPLRIVMAVFSSITGRSLSIVTDLWILILAASGAVWAAAVCVCAALLGCGILLCCRKPSERQCRMGALAAVAGLLAVVATFVIQPSPLTQPEPVPAATVLRLAAFNVRGSDIPDGPRDGWAPHRRHRARAMLWQLDADVVGLQEALEEQTVFFLAALPPSGRANGTNEYEVLDSAAASAAVASGRRYVAVGERTNSDHPSRDSQLLYDASRLALRSSGTLWLSATPDIPDSKVPGSANVRSMTWALLERASAAGEQREQDASAAPSAWCARCFLFVNLHLDHIGERARQEQAALARSFAQVVAARVVMRRAATAACGEPGKTCDAAALARHVRPLAVHFMGDFNSIRDSAAHGILTADQDASVHSGASHGTGSDTDADAALQSLVFAATARLISSMDAAGQLTLDNAAAAAAAPQVAATAGHRLHLWDSLSLVQQQARVLRANADAAAPGTEAAASAASAAESAEAELQAMDPISFHAFLGRMTGSPLITLPLRLLVSLFAVTLPPPNPLQWRGPAWTRPPVNAIESALASASWKLSAWAAQRTQGAGGSKRSSGGSHATDLHIDWILTGYYGPSVAALADAVQPARRPRQLIPGMADVAAAAPNLMVAPDGWSERPGAAASRLRLRVINAPSGEGYCSDHYPVTLDFLTE